MNNNDVNPWMPIIVLLLCFALYLLIVKFTPVRNAERRSLMGGPNTQPVTEETVDDNHVH